MIKHIPINFKSLKKDIPASIVLFLVALPISLGMPLATNTPVVSGIISGIIGGLFVGIFSKSNTSVSGAAIGIATVFVTTIAILGSYESALLALFISGLIQILMGLARVGNVSKYIPLSVLRGLLTSIGILLILKQIPHIVGYDKDLASDFSLFKEDSEGILVEITNIFNNIHSGAVIISLISLAIMYFWDKIPFRVLKIVPSYLFVIIVAIITNEVIFIDLFPTLHIKDNFLISLPTVSTWQNIITFPNFSAVLNINTWIYGAILAITISTESLLNLEAIESIDPHQRRVSPNRELIIQGTANSLGSLIGAFPVVSTLIRSSVSIYAGAQTKMATIFHGILFLLSLVALGTILNLIPFACLASILIAIGYKIVNIEAIKRTYKESPSQLVPFIVTIIAILGINLPIGILIGVVSGLFFVLRSNYNQSFELSNHILHVDAVTHFELPKQVSFLSKALIKDTLWATPNESKMVIDATDTDYIDYDVVKILKQFIYEVVPEKKIQLNFLINNNPYQLENIISFSNALNKDSQSKLNAEQVLEILQEGNLRFLRGESNKKYLKHQVEATASQQSPMAIILSCIDSRTSVEHVFDLGLGDIFGARIAGNIVNDDILGSMEFATHVMGVKLVMVLGHTKCGAVKGACAHVELGHLTGLLNKIEPAIQEEIEIIGRDSIDANNSSLVDKVAENNVHFVIKEIRERSPIIANLEKEEKIKLIGAFYDVESGEVFFYDT